MLARLPRGAACIAHSKKVAEVGDCGFLLTLVVVWLHVLRVLLITAILLLVHRGVLEVFRSVRGCFVVDACFASGDLRLEGLL